jgi:hypothetical protein
MRYSPSELEPAQERPRSDQDQVQPKRAVVLVGEPGMRALGVEHLEYAVDVVLAVLGPFVSVDSQKTDLGEQGPAVLLWSSAPPATKHGLPAMTVTYLETLNRSAFEAAAVVPMGQVRT